MPRRLTTRQQPPSNSSIVTLLRSSVKRGLTSCIAFFSVSATCTNAQSNRLSDSFVIIPANPTRGSHPYYSSVGNQRRCPEPTSPTVVMPDILPPSPTVTTTSHTTENGLRTLSRSRAPLHQKRAVLCRTISRSVELPESTMRGILDILSQVVPNIYMVILRFVLE
ncbi:hypothetical protein FRC03_004062 [Tulasnella sp. 419]|nr:hypothetical protein FRC02_004130 [Tulasnella sp. 418]KAG8970680.1 hypothetical protein FRC03_004062 [Tulasnella sp. 419]